MIGMTTMGLFGCFMWMVVIVAVILGIAIIIGMLPTKGDLDQSAPPMPDYMKKDGGEYKHEYLGELVGVDSSGKPVFEKNGKVTGIEYGYGYKALPEAEKMNLSSMPWKVNPCGAKDAVYATVDDAKGDNIACIDDGNMCVEDARMCAAAPEMYTDLREACCKMCAQCKVSADDRREVCDQCFVAGWLETLAKAAGHDKVEVK